MNKPIAFFISLTFMFSLCNMPELKEIKLKPDMQSIANRYKQELESEVFDIVPGWFQFDTIVIHRVIVSIYNSNKLPDSETKIDELAKNIATDVYAQIINKEDFSEILVNFTNQKGVALANFKTTRNIPFKCDELKNEDINLGDKDTLGL